jgi:hypothetical protein
MRVGERRERRRQRRGRPAVLGASREARRRDVQALGGGAHDFFIGVCRHTRQNGRDTRAPNLRAHGARPLERARRRLR